MTAEPTPLGKAQSRGPGEVVPLRSGRSPDSLGNVRVHMPAPGPRWKWALIVCGAVNLVLGLPQLLGITLFGAGIVDTTHVVRDGALACVLGVICIAFALRPRWGRPLTVVAVLVFVLQIVSGVTDASVGRVEAVFESVHVVAAISVLTCALALGRSAPRVSGA